MQSTGGSKTRNRDRLRALLWLAALSAAAAAVILQGRPEHVAMLALIGALLAQGRWRRAVEARRRRNQGQRDEIVVSAAGYLRESLRRNGARIDGLALQVGTLWEILGLMRDAAPQAPPAAEAPARERHLRLAKRDVG